MLETLDSPNEAFDRERLRRTHRLLRRECRGIRGVLVIQAVCSVLSVILVIAAMGLLSLIVHGVFRAGRDLTGVSIQMSALAGCVFLRAVVIWLAELAAQRGAIRLKADLRARIVARVTERGPMYIRRERPGELVNTALEGVEKLDAYFARFVPAAIHLAVAPLLIAAYVLLIDPLSGVILLMTGPLIPLFMWLIGTHAGQKTRRQWRVMGRMSSHFLDVIQGLKTLKQFGAAKRQRDRIAEVTSEFRRHTMGILKIAFLSGLVLELAASLSTALVAVQIGVRLVEGHLLFQPGFLVLLLAPEFYLPFRRYGAQHHAAMEGAAAAERIYAMVEHRPLALHAHAARTARVFSAPPRIRFDGVHFTYAGSDHAALSNIHLTLESGTTTALVGHSGAGKSTLIALLLRFLEPDSGRIRVDDEPLNAFSAADWRRHVAYVSQHPHFFNGSVRENLRAARPDAGDGDMEQALREAEAWEFVRRLPGGLESPLIENASQLSGGERQRLALARAWLKDASVWVLDEPSSFLDLESEDRVVTALHRMIRHRTVLISAHRLNTVRHADQIVLLESGCMRATGSHQELLASSETYAAMVQRAAGSEVGA